MDDFFSEFKEVSSLFSPSRPPCTHREESNIAAEFASIKARCWPSAVVVRLNHSPKTMTSVILTVFILALGMRPRELARLQSASSSAACPSAKKYTQLALITL